ncbi:unnamed protein product [Discula destructiva]
MATLGQKQSAGHFGEGIEPVVYQHGQYPEHYEPPPAPSTAYAPEKGYHEPLPAGARGATILGMTRKVFWVVLVTVVVLLGLVVGLGAGLGARVNRLDSASQSSDAAAPSNTSSSATTTSASLPTATYTTATSTAATAVIPCPAQNNTLYKAHAATLTKFRLYCDVDFSGDEAADLAQVDTVSMEACMDVCASTDKCQGAGWGSTGSVSSAYTCYMKTNLTSGHDASDSAWSFAVNLNTTSSISIKK